MGVAQSAPQVMLLLRHSTMSLVTEERGLAASLAARDSREVARA